MWIWLLQLCMYYQECTYWLHEGTLKHDDNKITNLWCRNNENKSQDYNIFWHAVADDNSAYESKTKHTYNISWTSVLIDPIPNSKVNNNNNINIIIIWIVG